MSNSLLACIGDTGGAGAYSANSSAIVGGQNNRIGTTGSAYYSSRSFIGGGANNTIDAATASSNYNFIGGGSTNFIDAGTSYSSILGGQANIIPAGAAYNNTHIIGSGIVVGPAAGNGIAGALNINALWANAIPLWNLGLRVGTVSWYPAPAGFPAGSRVLMLR